MNSLRLFHDRCSVFAGKAQGETTPLDNVFTIRTKGFFFSVKLQCRACRGGKRT